MRDAAPGRGWHRDEVFTVFTRVGETQIYPSRAVDEHGQVLGVFLQAQRDPAAAGRFFRRVLGVTGDAVPAQITTDKLGSDAAVLARVPEPAATEHLRVRAARRCNNRVEQAHQPTRVRERLRRRLKSSAAAQRFLDAFSRAANLFRRRLECPSAR